MHQKIFFKHINKMENLEQGLPVKREKEYGMCASRGGWAERRVHEGAKESVSLDQG